MKRRIVKYEEEDIAPMVMSVIIYAVNNCITLLWAIAIEQYYPDLYGLVDIDDIGEETCALINLPEDPLMMRMADLIQELNEVVYSLANVNLLEFEDAYVDENLRAMAEDIYWSLIYYTTEADDLEQFHFLLSGYLSSLQDIFYWLLHLVQYKEIDYKLLEGRSDISLHRANVDLENRGTDDFTLTILKNVIPELFSCSKWLDEFLEKNY